MSTSGRKLQINRQTSGETDKLAEGISQEFQFVDPSIRSSAREILFQQCLALPSYLSKTKKFQGSSLKGSTIQSDLKTNTVVVSIRDHLVMQVQKNYPVGTLDLTFKNKIQE